MDYYKILGVDKNTPPEDIKKAYHKLAHKYHPDKQGGDEKKFKELNEAYQILSNPEKKKQYDMFGRVGGAGAGPQSGGYWWGGGNPGEWNVNFGDGIEADDLRDIFDSFFEGLGVKQKYP